MKRSKTSARRSLDLEQIASAALELVDHEGVGALTIRRLAEELGVGAMTLYGYVRTKEEIAEQLTELALRELDIPAEGRWDERIATLFGNLRELLWRHPAVAYLDAVQPLSGPAAFRAADAALGMLREGGLDREACVAGMSNLVSYTFGNALFRLAQASEQEPRKDYERRVRLATMSDLPNIADMAAQMLHRGGDEEFRMGLHSLIDGLRAHAQRTESIR
ncbi:MAG TPA: TetR/AcrR family transcriptional regulator C-terminal domain-containing protein [Pseudonocardia sp.]